MIDISVLLPSYLEAENLRIILPRLQDVLKGLRLNFEIIVIDTRVPMDDSPAICESNGVHYINRTPDNSFGSAVRSGIIAAQGTRVLFMDADGSHSPEFIPSLYARIGEGDLIIASRYTDGGATQNSRSLMWMSRILNFTYSLILGLDCKDVSNSFKIYKGKQLKELELNCDNFDIVEEIFYKLKVLNPGFKNIEVPFCFQERMFGTTKRNLLVFIITYLFTLFKLRLSPVRRRPILASTDQLK